jgi:streptomycin 6-kinase
MYGRYLDRWGLVPAGEPIETRNSRLLPVRHQGIPAMLKVAIEPEEKFGAALMAWWDGDGEATRLICATVAKVHRPRPAPATAPRRKRR